MLTRKRSGRSIDSVRFPAVAGRDPLFGLGALAL